MCGGSTTTQQQVTIPPEVLQRYQDVNNRADQVANNPFQVYSTDPNSFVAPLTSTQQAGITNTNAAAGQAQPYFDAATGQLISAQQGVQPYFGAAGSQYLGAEGAGLGYLPVAQQNIDFGQAYAGAGASQALHSLQGANRAAQPLTASAAENISQGLAGAQPFNMLAGAQYGAGLAAAQPLNEAANQNISGAYAGAQPYQQLATSLGLGGAQAVNPSQLTGASINQYLNPYLGTVLNSTAALLNQQNQQQQSGALGDAIRNGAFGGDRAGIAAANLAQQQQLANANIFSGILSQGYGQALSTAQQQQGLNLSAEQANRAALQAASGQLQSIGQQGFGQGITTAQQQAALGQQQFGQGLSAGQAYQGLGQQLYGQATGTGQAQAALGNQLFSQGATTAQLQNQIGQDLFQNYLNSSQQEAALGQQAFGIGSQTGQNLQGLGALQYQTGANTAQQLAGLGAGAQSAALQGAQAQMAAGQAQQQTQQAGLTALYNQFLQQQSYPFQVAQFLANIAEGTGALSGSTTTTTQPGGFFSDERLKTDIKPVGMTFDHQPIYSYKYKGDPRTQIGLIAQDVEKTHPEATGLAAGFKAVDYGKATKDAAKRGHFADGGLAGYDPNLMEQLLSNQRGMYGPYLAGTGGPYGGSSLRVPAATLPVGELKVAGPIPQQASVLQRAKDISDLATTASKGVDDAKKGLSWAKAKLGSDDSDPPYARGGRLARAMGGETPYEDQEGALSLDIPNDKPSLKLATPGQAPQSQSGVGGVKDAAEAALAVAKLAAMVGLKRGGTVRKGYALDGAVNDDDPDIDEISRQVAGGGAGPLGLVYKPTDDTHLPQIPVGQVTPKQIGRAGLGAIIPGLNEIAPMVRNLSSLGVTPQGIVRSGLGAVLPAVNEVAPIVRGLSGMGVGSHTSAPSAPAAKSKAATPRKTASASAAPPNVGAPVGQIAAPPPGLGSASPPVTDTTQPQTVDASAVKPAGLAAASQPIIEGPDDLQAAKSDLHPGLMQRLQDSPIGDYFSGLKHGDMPTWVSLLSALGAAGTAPTVHPGVALAAGLSAGARGYLGAKEQQAEIAHTQAEAEQTQAQANATMQLHTPPGYVAVPGPGPHGEHFTGPGGQPWHYELQVNATNFDQGAADQPKTVSQAAAEVGLPTMGPSSDTDAFVAQQYHLDPSQTAVANRARALAMNPALGELDDQAQKSAQARIGNLDQTDTSQRQILQLSQAINELSRGTLSGQGHGSEYRTKLVNMGVTAANLLGLPVPSDLTADLTEQQIIQKIKTLMGPALASQNDERAASIARAISGVLPGGDLTPQAANELLSQMLLQTQKSRDFAQYDNAYVSRYGLSAGVEPSFQRDVGPRYGLEQAKLAQFMGSEAYPLAMADLQSPDAAIRSRAVRSLDAIGGHGFHRYFTLGQ